MACNLAPLTALVALIIEKLRKSPLGAVCGHRSGVRQVRTHRRTGGDRRFAAHIGKSSFWCGPISEPRRQPKTNRKHSTGPVGKEPSRWNCALPRASLGSSRTATALSELVELLDPVYGRLAEGFETTDLRAAKTLLHGVA